MAYRFGSSYDARMAARRRRRRTAAGVAMLAVVTVVVVAAAIASIGHRAQAEKVRGNLGWTLVAVAEDARTLTVARESNICGSRAVPPVVTETRAEVVIRLPRIQLSSDEVDCLAVSGRENVRVRLAAALGTRMLRQPKWEHFYGPPAATPPAGAECVRLERMPSQAPARRVPWVRNRLRLCRD